MAGLSTTRAEVRLAVRDKTGRPVAEASLSVVASSVPFPEIAFLTDETGVVQVFLPAGEFTFRAHGSDGVEGTARVISDGSSPIRAEIIVR